MKKPLRKTTSLLLLFSILFLGNLTAGTHDDSEIVEVESILELRGLEAGGATIYKLTGEVILTYQQAWQNQKWVQDETAGIMIHDPDGVISSTYTLHDGITGLTGKLGVFRNNFQLLPTADPGEATSSDNSPTVVERTLESLTPDDQGRLVVVPELAFDEEQHGVAFAGGRNYTVSDPTGTGVFRTEFRDADYIGAAIPAEPRSVTAIIHMFNDDLQMIARSLEDLQISEIPNILALRNQNPDGETIYTLSNEVILTFQQAWQNQKWVQDETAGIMIHDPDGIITSAYQVNDGITGLKGKLGIFRNNLQIIPVEDPGPASSSDNEPLVVERTIESLTQDDQGRLVVINEVSFDETHHGEQFTGGKNFTISDPTATGIFRTEFRDVDYIGSPVPLIPQNITAIIHMFNDDIQVIARSSDDFEASGDIPTYSLSLQITDEDGVALGGAVVSLNDESYDAGMYVIENLLPAVYDYVISLDGYHPATGQVVIVNEDKTLGIMLIAVDPDMVTDFPFTEGFEDDFPPAGWKHYAMGDAGTWTTHATANSGSAAAHHNFTAAGEQADSWLVSPQIQLPEEETMLLSFFERNSLMNDYGYSGVWISTGSANPANEHYVELYESNASIGAYTEKTINLADYKGQVVNIAFVYRGDDAHQWWIDDLKVEQAPDVIEVPNIAALREQGTFDGTVFRITGEVILTHQNGNRNQKYFQDDTGAILVDDAAPSGSPAGTPGVITTVYQEYDAIAGLTGTISPYNQMWQLLPTEDPGPAVSQGNVIEPLLMTISEMGPAHQAMLIELKEVTITKPDGQTDFTGSRSYTISDTSGTGILRTPHNNAGLDYFNTPIPDTPKDIVGVVVQFNDDIQIAPRSLADFTDPGTTNISELNNKNVVVYPNPAQTHFNLRSDSHMDAVRIFDMRGRLLLSTVVNDTQTQIAVNEFKNGLYIVQIIHDDGVESLRLQVTR